VACEIYGVVLVGEPVAVDEEATRRQSARLADARGPISWTLDRGDDGRLQAAISGQAAAVCDPATALVVNPMKEPDRTGTPSDRRPSGVNAPTDALVGTRKGYAQGIAAANQLTRVRRPPLQ
jgi:hypothetical protein